MNQVFKWCVDVLRFYAHKWNMTYEELNVWIFCIIEPIIFLILCYVILRQFNKIKSLKKSINSKT